MKATKKPVTVECIKWDGDNKDVVEYFCGKSALFYPNMLTGTEELSIKTLEGNLHASVGDIIIKGVNGELYPCKPDIFDKTYDIVRDDTKIETDDSFTHSFSWALEMMKKGHKIHRSGWNGKSQYVELATSISYKNVEGEIINCNHDAIGNKALAFVGTSGVQMGWLASQADMLANDWAVVTDICGGEPA